MSLRRMLVWKPRHPPSERMVLRVDRGHCIAANKPLYEMISRLLDTFRMPSVIIFSFVHNFKLVWLKKVFTHFLPQKSTLLSINRYSTVFSSPLSIQLSLSLVSSIFKQYCHMNDWFPITSSAALSEVHVSLRVKSREDSFIWQYSLFGA